MESIRDSPPLLTAFLRAMPKGADLHSHLGGAVYAESWLEWAAEDGSCISRRELRILNAPCTPAGDTVPATAALRDPDLHRALVDRFSVRNWHPALLNGHDRFFDSFGKFAALRYRVGDQVAEVQNRAAAGGVHYLELMQTLDNLASWGLADRAGWHAELDVMRDTLLALGLESTILPAAVAELDRIEARRDSLLACDTPDPQAGCDVTVRWLYQVLRAQSPERVFAQIQLGFLLTRADPRVVGLNLVQPEDWHIAVADYSLHMRMIEHLHRSYPDVSVTLHAGELVPGLVPPDALRSHIREAVEVAGARRIGHGVAIMHEPEPHALLRQMAARGILVEINLTSNDIILGVRGPDHPLRWYLEAGVPVALSTDDEGVARSEMTMEYLKAVQEQGLDYATLKRMARHSLEFAFVEGASLWSGARTFEPVAACVDGFETVSCEAHVAENTKARLQRRLEQGFAAFEARHRQY